MRLGLAGLELHVAKLGLARLKLARLELHVAELGLAKLGRLARAN